MKNVAAVIVAGGSGSRMGSNTKKQYLKIKDKEVLAHTVQVFENLQEVQEIIVVTGEEDIAYVEEMLRDYYGYQKVVKVVAGGSERQYSVYNGIQAVSKNIDYLLIHDAARPLIKEDVVKRGIEMVYEKAACIVAVPVKDTIKVASMDGKIESTPKRETLWSVQTPQLFKRSLIVRAHEEAREKGILGTDDSMLIEALGETVYIIEGDYTNIKITTPEDLVIAERLIEQI